MATETRHARLIRSADQIEVAFKHLLHRAMQAEAEYEVTADLFVDAMNTAIDHYQTESCFSKGHTPEQRANLLVKWYDEETKEIDRRYPSKGGSQ